MTTETPHMVHSDDFVSCLSDGAEQLAMMVRMSIHEANELPPPETLAWYVHYVALRFVFEEYNALYKPHEESLMTVELLAAEIDAMRAILARNKQFALSMKIDHLLNTRQMHLPEAYIAQLDKKSLLPCSHSEPV